MPIYEYRCNECNSINELFMKINDGSKSIYEKCNFCLRETCMNKVISKCTFKLEGRGWGKDGYENTSDRVKELI